MDLGVIDSRDMVAVPDSPRGSGNQPSQAPGDAVLVPGAVLGEGFQGFPGGGLLQSQDRLGDSVFLDVQRHGGNPLGEAVEAAAGEGPSEGLQQGLPDGPGEFSLGHDASPVSGQLGLSPPGKFRPGDATFQYGTPAQLLWSFSWKLLPKKNGKMRPLGIPTMRDRAMQALYLQALDPIAETMADPNSYGFRKERSTADAIEQCHIVLSNRGGARWIFEGDIKSCFDRISHEWLMAHIPMCKTILQKWLKAGFMEKHVFYATEEGTPQGGICSPVLANMALDGLERELRGRYPKASALSRKAKVNLVRYADDFIITGSSKKLLEEEVKPLVESFLKERGLELSAEKTHITRIEDGFDFLGQNVRDYGGTIVVKPSRKNVATFLEKVRGIIKASKHVTAGHLIVNLNPVIRGWANYHRHVASKRTFSRVDHAIFRALWQWAKRRHPKKSRQWIKDRYFETIDQRHWVFHGTVAGREEVIQPVWLLAASSVPIQRHTKIKGEANPYDPAWEPYFEERLGVKMTGTLAGRWTLRLLWKEQGGICPVCNQKITTVTGWHNHHIVWRTHGGKDTIENRVLVHPNCHQQIHSQELDVGKPRPAKGVREA